MCSPMLGAYLTNLRIFIEYYIGHIYMIIMCCFFKNLAPPPTWAFQNIGNHPTS